MRGEGREERRVGGCIWSREEEERQCEGKGREREGRGREGREERW